MKAFWTVVRLELRLFIADRVLSFILVAFLACSAYALVSGALFTRGLDASGKHVLAEERALLRTQRDTLEQRERSGEEPPSAFYDPSNPAAVGVFAGRYAVLPPSPWAALALGQSDVSVGHVLVTTQSRWTQGDSTDTENPLLLLLGRFDLAFVFIVLFPLIILAASYDLVSRERELGRLGLILAQPTTPKLLLGARVLGRMLPILGLGIAISIAGFLMSGGRTHSAEGLLRVALWCLLVVAYGAFWFACALLVNVVGGRSTANALALLGIWLVFVIVLPSTFDLGIGALHPLPSRIERSLLARTESRAAEQRADELLGGYYRDHPELSLAEGGPSLDFLPRYLAVTERVDAVVAPVFERFERSLQSQREASADLRFVSPALILQWALCDLAGTGSVRWDRFRASVSTYQKRWRDVFLPLSFAKRRLTSSDLAALPEFDFQEEPAAALLVRAGTALGALTLLAGAVFLVALRLGLRLPAIR